MKKIDKEYNNYFKPFIEEIEKYAEGTHDLLPGISMELVEKCEEKLNIQLPMRYKEFLTICNGGEVFNFENRLTSVRNPEEPILMLGGKKGGVSYIEETFEPGIRKLWIRMPESFVIIGYDCGGDAYCIDLEESSTSEALIIQWSHETSEVIDVWSSLIKWLMHLIKLGEMDTNYDGTRKN